MISYLIPRCCRKANTVGVLPAKKRLNILRDKGAEQTRVYLHLVKQVYRSINSAIQTLKKRPGSGSESVIQIRGSVPKGYGTGTLVSLHNILIFNVADTYQGTAALLTPGSGIQDGKIVRARDEHPRSYIPRAYKQFFGLKIL
jgi:hypothetical protein